MPEGLYKLAADIPSFKAERRPRMNRRSAAIARSLFWDALILLALSVYELCVRLDAMWGPLKMFVNMAVGEGIPLRRVVTYVDITIFYVPLYMLLCAVVALCALASRRTRRTCARLLLPCAALAAAGFLLPVSLLGRWTRTLQLLSLVLMLALCLIHALSRPRPVRHPEQPPAPLPQQPPVRHRRSDRRAS